MTTIEIYFIIFFLFLLILINLMIMIFFLSFLFFDVKNKAFYAPSNKKLVQQFLTLFPFEKEKIFYDLGSGDGRVVFEAAKRGLKAIGIENNPWLYLLAKIKKSLMKIDKAHFFLGDFRKIDFREADYIYLYLLPTVLEELEEKIFKNAKKGSVIISFTFLFPKRKVDEIYLEKFYVYYV